MLPGAGRGSWSRVVEAGWIGARIGYTMLFVIATKLDVFLQLTPEMQTHLPQPLNRISFGIILRTQAPGCDEDEGIQITEMQMHQLLLMDATQWLCVRKYVSVCVCLCVRLTSCSCCTWKSSKGKSLVFIFQLHEKVEPSLDSRTSRWRSPPVDPVWFEIKCNIWQPNSAFCLAK